jgi:hypothetical protein
MTEPPAPEVTHDQSARERKLVVCSSAGKLDAADRAEILVMLCNDADEVVAKRALETLSSQPVEAFVEALKRDEAVPALFEYAADNLVGQPAVAEALVHNKNCPAKYLASHVPYLSAMSVQALMESLDRVSESADLAAALLESSSVTADNKRLLEELLEPELPMDESAQSALLEALMDVEPDAEKRQTLLQKLAKMSVSQRVQFAMKGGSEARRTLIRDSNKVVQRAVLQSPRLTDQEVEAFAAMPSLTDEILRLIANNRAHRKNYTVVRNLMNNSKTPLDVTLHMLPMLNAIDLKKLSTNKNVPETLRTTASKLIRTRATQRQ